MEKGNRGKKTSSKQNKKRLEIERLCKDLLKICTVSVPKDKSKALCVLKDIFDILRQLRKLEADTGVYDRNYKANIKSFMKWADDNGAKHGGVEIEEFPGYDLGLKTTMDIPEHSIVITVPRKLMMTVDSAQQSELQELVVKDKILGGMDNVALSMFLLLEKLRGTSFWKPYIDVLPVGYTTLLYFTYDDFLELREWPYFEAAVNFICCIARQYTYFNNVVHTSEDAASKILRKGFTYDNYRWAVSTIMTRQNSIPSEDGAQLVSALIPLWDFCNHTNGSISTQYNPELHQSECLAFRSFKKNEQFFISYGQRTNYDFFMHNGFVYDDNINDRYSLKLSLNQKDPLYAKRLRLCDRFEIPASNIFYISKQPEPFSTDLIGFLQILKATESNLDEWISDPEISTLPLFLPKADKLLLKQIYFYLKISVELFLKSYNANHGRDLQQLDDPRVSACKKLAVRLRLNEMNILVGALMSAVAEIDKL